MKKNVPGLAFAIAIVCLFASCKKTITSNEEKSSTVASTQPLQLICLPREDPARTAAAQRTTAISSQPVVLLLDFNGENVTNSTWFNPGTINCPAVPASLLTSQMKDYIVTSVAEDFSPFLVKVTKNESEYRSAPANRRVRCVLTYNMLNQFGNVGGVAFISSMSWGDNTPCFVFCDILQYNQKYIAGAVSHELGHTLGLQHQSRYGNDCSQLEEYHTGFGYANLGWAPIMGISYYQNLVTWHNGATSLGCNEMQNDMSMIGGLAGIKTDDYSAIFNSNTKQLPSSGNKSGILETAADKDAFLKNETTSRRIKVTSNGNSDIALEVYNTNGQLVTVYDDSNGPDINTVISGKKYLRVKVSPNQPFAPAGDGFGGYTINVSNP